MSERPIRVRWDGEAFVCLDQQQAEEADRRFEPGDEGKVIEDASRRTRNHFFACLIEAWKQLPEALAREFPSPAHLRAYALIKAGYHHAEAVPCASHFEALRHRAFWARKHPFLIMEARDNTLWVYTAESQSRRAMGDQAFAASKEAVLQIVADMCGVSVDELARNAREAA